MNTAKNKKGKLIVIDGSDGSGKATQTKLLVDRLQKEHIPAKKIDFPHDSNIIGCLIRESLNGMHGDFIGLDPKLASVIYGSDRFESKAKIEQWLNEGFTVVLDRYVSANQIHQGGKIVEPAAREDFLAWIEKVEYGVFGLPRPDIIIYLHVPLEISLELLRVRSQTAGKIADQAESSHKHQFDSQQNALKIIAKNNDWVKIDCDDGNGKLRSREDIHEEVFLKLERILIS